MNVIVSGASQGIGFQTALNFARKGCNVLAIARNKAKLGELCELDNRITLLATSLTDEDLQDKINTIWSKENIDIIINNAGALINSTFAETTLQDFREQFDSNVLTAVNLIQSVASKISEGTHIVNISSMGGFQGSSKFPGLSAYSTAKGALSILTECLAVEFQERGVCVNALALGAVQTEMLSKAFPDYQAPIQPAEMAEFISEFAMKTGKYMNGKIIPVSINNP